MPRDGVIQVEGKVIEVLPNRMIRVELVNGHRILARVSRRMQASGAGLSPGDTTIVEMSPYDMSKGSIVERINN